MGNFSFTEPSKDFSIQNQKFTFGTPAAKEKTFLNIKNIDIFGGNLKTSFNDSSVKDKAVSIFNSAVDDKNAKPADESEKKKNDTKNQVKGFGVTSVETSDAPGGYKTVSIVKNAGTIHCDTKKTTVVDKNGKTAFTVRRNEDTVVYEDKNGNTLYSIENQNNMQTLKNASGKVVYTCISEYDTETGKTNRIYKDANGKVITEEQAHKLENSLRTREMREFSKCKIEALNKAGFKCTDKNYCYPIDVESFLPQITPEH